MRILYIVTCLLFIVGCQSDKTKQTTASNPFTPPSTSENTMDAFYEACLNGDLNFVTKAVEGGVQVDSPNENGSTGMMLAA